MHKYLVLFEYEDNNWNAYVPDLPGCIAVADTKEETETLIYEAIKSHIELSKESGETLPETNTESMIMFFK